MLVSLLMMMLFGAKYKVVAAACSSPGGAEGIRFVVAQEGMRWCQVRYTSYINSLWIYMQQSPRWRARVNVVKFLVFDSLCCYITFPGRCVLIPFAFVLSLAALQEGDVAMAKQSPEFAAGGLGKREDGCR